MLPRLAWDSWAEMILLPRLLEYLGLQANDTMSGYVISLLFE